MRAARTTVALAALTLTASSGACNGSGDDKATDAATSGGEAGQGDAAAADATADANVATSDAGSSDQTETGTAPASVAGIRIANWSPDAPAIDLCLAPHATGAFRGPLLGDLRTEDSGIASLPFPNASAYTLMSPGQYDARLVVAGASDCSVSIGTDVTDLPPLIADGYATIALIGEENPAAGEPSLTLVGFLDDAYVATGADVRFINASPWAGLTLADFGEVSGTTFKPLFLGVHYGQAGNSTDIVPGGAVASVDAHGYSSIGAISGANFAVRARNGAANLALSSGTTVAAGAVVTFIAVGSDSIALVECVDNAGTLGYSGVCGVISAGGDAGGL